MVKAYVKGRRFEYRVKRELERDGYLVFRTAGSRGVADLVAIKDGAVYLVQCKNRHIKTVSKKEVEELIRICEENSVTPVLAYNDNGCIVRLFGSEAIRNFKKIADNIKGADGNGEDLR